MKILLIVILSGIVAMHRNERIEAERIEKLKMKYIPENKSSNRA